MEKVPECSEDAPIVPIFHPKLQQGGDHPSVRAPSGQTSSVVAQRSGSRHDDRSIFFIFFFISFLGVKIKKNNVTDLIWEPFLPSCWSSILPLVKLDPPPDSSSLGGAHYLHLGGPIDPNLPINGARKRAFRRSHAALSACRVT